MTITNYVSTLSHLAFSASTGSDLSFELSPPTSGPLEEQELSETEHTSDSLFRITPPASLQEGISRAQHQLH